ncbi:hypothetical protein HMPREF1982_04250 [Clostridiales bacterium oral taxon 876 str. F0540]|nr:hypothetical protein HMPREF1982_04250 [Clostridiales bacterium oral taxon 876 str. F0540]
MNMQVQFTSLKDVRRTNKNKKPKLIIYSIIIILLAANIGGLYIGNTFYKKAFNIDTKKDIDLYDANKTTFNERRFVNLPKEEVSIASKNNYKLYGTYIKNQKTTKDTIILVHGLAGSRWTVLKYADMYLDKGYNVLVYDSKNHGHSGGDNVTYGYDEQNDLDSWVRWIYLRNKGGVIGVHGESMGASTALLQAKLNEDKKRVSFYIVDSPYSDLKDLFTLRIKEDYNIKNKLVVNLLLFYAEKVNQLKNHFKFSEASPKYVVKDITTPVLFIQGDQDNFIPNNSCSDLYKLKTGTKELFIVPNAAHVKSYETNPEAYKDKVYNFIDKVISVK